MNNFHPLESVFNDAIAQATNGKGEERHGQGIPFLEQKWLRLAESHGIGFLSGQAQKKIEEAMNYYHQFGVKADTEKAWWEREMLGALNYLAMAILYVRIKEGEYDIHSTGD